MWFLGGTFSAVPAGPNVVKGIEDRTCTVPVGTALFFPIINAECSTLELNGNTESMLRSCANGLADHALNLQAQIDGVPITNLQSYRAQSPLFIFGPLPANNILENSGFVAPAGATSPSVADGFYLLLAPLSAGYHTLHFSGSAIFTAARDGFDFEFDLDITYRLTIGVK